MSGGKSAVENAACSLGPLILMRFVLRNGVPRCGTDRGRILPVASTDNGCDWGALRDAGHLCGSLHEDQKLGHDSLKDLDHHLLSASRCVAIVRRSIVVFVCVCRAARCNERGGRLTRSPSFSVEKRHEIAFEMMLLRITSVASL